MPEVNIDEIARDSIQPVGAFLSPEIGDVDKT
jgi:hypothetical protein